MIWIGWMDLNWFDRIDGLGFGYTGLLWLWPLKIWSLLRFKKKKWKFAESHNKDKELGVILLPFYNDVAQRVLLQCCHILFFPLVTLLLKYYPFSYLFLVLLLLFLAKNYIFSFFVNITFFINFMLFIGLIKKLYQLGKDHLTTCTKSIHEGNWLSKPPNIIIALISHST